VANLHRFEGKVVLITGASRGIGKGIAQRFALEGADLVLNANEAGIHAVADELSGMGRQALALEADVSDPEQVNRVFAGAADEFGRIDISVHNAGIMGVSTLSDLSEEIWDRVLAVNTKGVFLCCKAAARIMTGQQSGRIINMASGAGREGPIYAPHYAASKFGVIGITQSLAKELAPFGITINAVCPGIIDTDMWAYNDREWGRLLGNYAPGELMRQQIEAIPMKRAGTPEDVAGVVAFLASGDADYVTGQTINVNGGVRMN
jgi:meso-butanediol dehydrogenase/(S,S)-butanediol dehydrogenase/diacetyl reductase